MNGIFDALVSAAAADVARHRLPYLIVGRFWIFDKQRGRLHDLTGLVIAALRHIQLAPGLLNRMVAGRVKAFNGGDLAADHVGNRGDARSARRPYRPYPCRRRIVVGLVGLPRSPEQAL